ncbi:MAG: M24 family metallopeptidase [Candidatus Micrarchaeota archaeon]|nr:M24 family metallopeptidase [Candidatus Micrarchaeota archaeon]
MEELFLRRERLFCSRKFSSAVIYSEGSTCANFSYFAGFWLDGCCLVLKKNRGVVLASRMNERQARMLSRYPVLAYGKSPAMQIRKLCGNGPVAYSGYEMSARRFFALKKKAGLRLLDAGEEMLSIRAEKSAAEIRKIGACARLAREILEGLEPWKFKTERQLAAELQILALKSGAEASFPPIVASDGNSAHPHHQPGSKRLGRMVLVDFGVRLDGYCSDITRCYFKGEGGRERQEYEKCAEAFGKIAGGLEKCQRGKDAAKLARRVLRECGLPSLIHSAGHGIGLEVHEKPNIGRKSQDRLPPGTVLAIEPAAYFKKFGVRFEDMVVRTEDGWRII